jgi:putative Holliday junction resolvase
VRVLALDIGARRVGVAVSDQECRIASPLRVLDASALAHPDELRRLIVEYEVGLVLIGLPLSLDGTEGPQAQHVREVGTRLADSLGVPVTYGDERLSTLEAKRAMSAGSVSDKHKRGRVDMIAATLFLQSYLDAQRSRAGGSPGEAALGGVDG